MCVSISSEYPLGYSLLVLNYGTCTLSRNWRPTTNYDCYIVLHYTN